MKTLIAYYSRTNITAELSKDIQKELNCDIEEIKDLKNRSGIFGYIKSGYEAMRGILTEIKPIEKDPSEYDLVLIGTPVWASTMANPILTYLTENKSKFNNVSFFCTCGGSGYEQTLSKMEKVLDIKPLETMYLTKKDINSIYTEKIKIYTDKLKTKVE